MSQRTPFTNTTANRMTVGGVAIRPGETRYVAERDHPDYRPARPVPVEHSHSVLEILDGSVRDITAQLPELSDDDLALVQQAEVDGKTRSTLLAAFEAEHLRRAEAAVDAAGGQDGD